MLVEKFITKFDAPWYVLTGVVLFYMAQAIVEIGLILLVLCILFGVHH